VWHLRDPWPDGRRASHIPAARRGAEQTHQTSRSRCGALSHGRRWQLPVPPAPRHHGSQRGVRTAAVPKQGHAGRAVLDHQRRDLQPPRAQGGAWPGRLALRQLGTGPNSPGWGGGEFRDRTVRPRSWAVSTTACARPRRVCRAAGTMRTSSWIGSATRPVDT